MAGSAVANAPARAFESLNLRWNPFGEATREDRIEMAISRLVVPGPGTKTQVIGDAGHGKTSSLLWLLPRLEHARYVHIADPAVAPPPPDLLSGAGPLLVDEAQRLPKRLRKALLQSARTVVFGTHEDLSSGAPGLQTLRLHSCPREFLEHVVAERLRWAQRSAGTVPRPTARLLDALLEQHHGDVRAIEHTLYERYQLLTENAHVDV